MRLRPFAPLTVVGAGLLMVALATHAASADSGQAPEAVQAASSGSGLVVSWQMPDGSSAPDRFELQVSGPTGASIADRTVAGSARQATLTAADLGAAGSARIVVSAAYGGSHADADALQVALHPLPPAPALAPAMRVVGRTLTIRIPKASPDGVTGRTVRVLRDGATWATVDVPLRRTTVTLTAAPGHRYAAAYRDVSSSGDGAFSAATVEVAVHGALGPTAVAQVAAERTSAGLHVSWLAATPQGADLDSYTVQVLQNGNRVGSSWTAPSSSEVLIPVQNLRGPVVVTVKAKDVSGASSTSTKTIDLDD